ncbi:MAG: MBL fold metallo-hydrolase [Flavobacteriaceae bacterium TMED171]|nr:MBL fold metallo-hydrolase [Flavobacteriaceae bacterium]OUW31691.1 MAG: MBL fold metallo-hydrolase [Flavobacteriaceae bacterium TMED171]|tara:strand:+ start:1079 stop:1930 length:852 start_codon:yes stop_codon:yes gene_type:complete
MELHSIACGNFKLDGGAMFGVVPKALWERTNPADTKNRIRMCSRSLLIEEGRRLILIDTGMGNKQNEKFFSHYDRWGTDNLDQSLREKGFHRDDITDVFFTHLHFDHCGDAIIRNANGTLEPSFKNAVFWTHEDHWRWATQPNAREKASFLPENILPIKESGQLQLLNGNDFILENTALDFDIILVNGHTEKQMLPLLKYKNKTIVFTADLIPTAGHLPVSYVMSYDTRPLLSLKEKNRFLKLAYKEDFLLFLEHDPYNELINLQLTDRGIRLNEKHTLSSFF